MARLKPAVFPQKTRLFRFVVGCSFRAVTADNKKAVDRTLTAQV